MGGLRKRDRSWCLRRPTWSAYLSSYTKYIKATAHVKQQARAFLEATSFRLKGVHMRPFHPQSAKEGDIPLISFDRSPSYWITLPAIWRWTTTWRLRKVLKLGIFSVKMLDWFAQAAVCQQGNPSIIFALSEFEKAKWKAFQSHCFLDIEWEDQTVCHENRCLEITFLSLISTSPLCIPKVLRPSKT